MSGVLEPAQVRDSWDVSNPAVAALARRYIRLADCVEWLRRNGIGSSL